MIQSPSKCNVECSIFEQNNNKATTIEVIQKTLNSVSVKIKSLEKEDCVQVLAQNDQNETETSSSTENFSGNNSENIITSEEEFISSAEKSIFTPNVLELSSKKDYNEKSLSGNKEVYFSLGAYLKSLQNSSILDRVEIPDTNSCPTNSHHHKMRGHNSFFISEDENISWKGDENSSLEDEENDSYKNGTDRIWNPLYKESNNEDNRQNLPVDDKSQNAVKIENNIRLVDYDYDDESSSDIDIITQNNDEVNSEKKELDLKNEINIDEGFQVKVSKEPIESVTNENNCFKAESTVLNPLSRLKTSGVQDHASRYEDCGRPKILDISKPGTIVTRSRLKKGKKMQRIWEKLKDLRVVLERLDINPKYCVSNVSKNEENRESHVENTQTSEDECPLVERLNIQPRNRRDSSINVENESSIVLDIEIPVDEVSLMIGDKTGEVISQILKLNPSSFQVFL